MEEKCVKSRVFAQYAKIRSMAKSQIHVKSAAEQYEDLKQQRLEDFIEESFSEESLKGVQLYEVTTPSGMKFKCRPLDKRFALSAGQMPMALTSQMIISSAKKTGGNIEGTEAEELFKSMTVKEQIASVQMSASMVRYICVEPRILLTPVNGNKNAICADDLTMNDFGALANWAKGGGSALGLKTFRRRRR